MQNGSRGVVFEALVAAGLLVLIGAQTPKSYREYCTGWADGCEPAYTCRQEYCLPSQWCLDFSKPRDLRYSDALCAPNEYCSVTAMTGNDASLSGFTGSGTCKTAMQAGGACWFSRQCGGEFDSCVNNATEGDLVCMPQKPTGVQCWRDSDCTPGNDCLSNMCTSVPTRLPSSSPTASPVTASPSGNPSGSPTQHPSLAPTATELNKWDSCSTSVGPLCGGGLTCTTTDFFGDICLESVQQPTGAPTGAPSEAAPTGSPVIDFGQSIAGDPGAGKFGYATGTAGPFLGTGDPVDRVVHLYVRRASGLWEPSQTLTPPTTTTTSLYGTSLAFDPSATLLAIGSPGAGVVYLYERSGAGELFFPLKYSLHGIPGSFGFSLAVGRSGRLIVGNHGSRQNSGSVWLYDIPGDGGNGYPTPAEPLVGREVINPRIAVPGNGDEFGYSVAVSGMYFAVGAPGSVGQLAVYKWMDETLVSHVIGPPGNGWSVGLNYPAVASGTEFGGARLYRMGAVPPGTTGQLCEGTTNTTNTIQETCAVNTKCTFSYSDLSDDYYVCRGRASREGGEGDLCGAWGQTCDGETHSFCAPGMVCTNTGTYDSSSCLIQECRAPRGAPGDFCGDTGTVPAGYTKTDVCEETSCEFAYAITLFGTSEYYRCTGPGTTVGSVGDLCGWHGFGPCENTRYDFCAVGTRCEADFAQDAQNCPLYSCRPFTAPPTPKPTWLPFPGVQGDLCVGTTQDFPGYEIKNTCFYPTRCTLAYSFAYFGNAPTEVHRCIGPSSVLGKIGDYCGNFAGGCANTPVDFCEGDLVCRADFLVDSEGCLTRKCISVTPTVSPTRKPTVSPTIAPTLPGIPGDLCGDSTFAPPGFKKKALCQAGSVCTLSYQYSFFGDVFMYRCSGSGMTYGLEGHRCGGNVQTVGGDDCETPRNDFCANGMQCIMDLATPIDTEGCFDFRCRVRTLAPTTAAPTNFPTNKPTTAAPTAFPTLAPVPTQEPTKSPTGSGVQGDMCGETTISSAQGPYTAVYELCVATTACTLSYSYNFFGIEHIYRCKGPTSTIGQLGDYCGSLGQTCENGPLVDFCGPGSVCLSTGDFDSQNCFVARCSSIYPTVSPTSKPTPAPIPTRSPTPSPTLPGIPGALCGATDVAPSGYEIKELCQSGSTCTLSYQYTFFEDLFVYRCSGAGMSYGVQGDLCGGNLQTVDGDDCENPRKDFCNPGLFCRMDTDAPSDANSCFIFYCVAPTAAPTTAAPTPKLTSFPTGVPTKTPTRKPTLSPVPTLQPTPSPTLPGVQGDLCGATTVTSAGEQYPAVYELCDGTTACTLAYTYDFLGVEELYRCKGPTSTIGQIGDYCGSLGQTCENGPLVDFCAPETVCLSTGVFDSQSCFVARCSSIHPTVSPTVKPTPAPIPTRSPTPSPTLPGVPGALCGATDAAPEGYEIKELCQSGSTCTLSYQYNLFGDIFMYRCSGAGMTYGVQGDLCGGSFYAVGGNHCENPRKDFCNSGLFCRMDTNAPTDANSCPIYYCVAPTAAPTTAAPTTKAPTAFPTAFPTTKAPTTAAPTAKPTAFPTTKAPTTKAPTPAPTLPGVPGDLCGATTYAPGGYVLKEQCQSGSTCTFAYSFVFFGTSHFYRCSGAGMTTGVVGDRCGFQTMEGANTCSSPRKDFCGGGSVCTVDSGSPQDAGNCVIYHCV
jgi:hypothetical protein